MSPPVGPSQSATNSFYQVSSTECDEHGPKLCYYSTAKRQSNRNFSYYDQSLYHLGDLRITVQAYGSTEFSAIGRELPDTHDNAIAVLRPESFGQSKNLWY